MKDEEWNRIVKRREFISRRENKNRLDILVFRHRKKVPYGSKHLRIILCGCDNRGNFMLVFRRQF